MNKENNEILNRIDKEKLLFVKSEAELQMDEMTLSETTIISKANSYFQVFLVIMVSLMGYMISQFSDFDYSSLLNQVCIIFLIALFYSLYLLNKTLYPKLEGLKGSAPKNLLQKDIFNNSKDEFELLLSNRINSLQNCIDKRMENQKSRVRNFKRAVNTILLSLIIIICYSAIYYFFTSPS